MKNVIVFAHSQFCYCIELRWVREVFTLGYVTPVPLAPMCFLGMVNFRGAILPVMDIRCLREERTDNDLPAVTTEGDSAILIECEEVQVALRIDGVEEVVTLDADHEHDVLRDATGREIALLHPPRLIDSARQQARDTAHEHQGDRE